MASMTTASETTDMIASLRSASANKEAEIQRQAKTIGDLETSNIQLEANLENAKADNDNEMPAWAIAIIVVIGAVLLLVIVILAVVVSR